MDTMAMSPVDRVLMHVTKKDGHWLYNGALDKDGYGVIRTGSRKADGKGPNRRRMRFAHEIVAEHFEGPAPEGHEWDHECGIRNCVKPAHLTARSKQANLARRDL